MQNQIWSYIWSRCLWVIIAVTLVTSIHVSEHFLHFQTLLCNRLDCARFGSCNRSLNFKNGLTFHLKWKNLERDNWRDVMLFCQFYSLDWQHLLRFDEILQFFLPFVSWCRLWSKPHGEIFALLCYHSLDAAKLIWLSWSSPPFHWCTTTLYVCFSTLRRRSKFQSHSPDWPLPLYWPYWVDLSDWRLIPIECLDPLCWLHCAKCWRKQIFITFSKSYFQSN